MDVVLSSTWRRRPGSLMEIVPKAKRGSRSYLRLGVEHILSGWDHLAFLLSPDRHRVRGSARWSVLVTGFTVGHSVTLAAAALGAVVPHPRVG